MKLFATSFWPDREVNALLRMALALLGAPLIVTAILTLIAFTIAGMSESSRTGVMAVTKEAAVQFLTISMIFTFSVGLIGVAGLWAFAQRGFVTWFVTGGVLAVLATEILGLSTGAAVNQLQIVIAISLGCTTFILIRWIAGIRN